MHLRTIAIVLALISPPVRAVSPAPLFVNGFGYDQCGQYVEAYRQGVQGYAPYIDFVQGYASAMSANTAITEGRTIDYTGHATVEAMAVWLNNYCTKHPLDLFGVATEAFLESASGIPSRLHYLRK